MKLLKLIKKYRIKLILLFCGLIGMFTFQLILFHYFGNSLAITFCVCGSYLLGNTIAILDDYFEFRWVNRFLREIKRRMENEIQSS